MKEDPSSVELKYYVKNQTLKITEDAEKIRALFEKLDSAAHPTKARIDRDKALTIGGGLLVAVLLLAAAGVLIFTLALAVLASVTIGGIIVALLLAAASLLPMGMIEAGDRNGIIQGLSQTKEYSDKHLAIIEEISAMSISPDDSVGLKLMP